MSDPSPTRLDDQIPSVSRADAARIKAAEVFDKTRKSWTEWFILLEEFNVAVHGKTAGIHFLCNEYDLDRWWAAAILTRYIDVMDLDL